LEGRDYALIRLDERKLNISDVARIVAGVEGRPLADVSMRLKGGRGVLAKDLERDVAEGMAKVLAVRGIRCAVVSNDVIAVAPKPKRCTQLTLSAKGLALKGGKLEESFGWDGIELVNCGRVRLLDNQPDRGGIPSGSMPSAPIVGFSGLPAIAVGRRQYVKTVSKDPYSLVIDIFTYPKGGHYRLYEGLFKASLKGKGGEKSGELMSRDRRLAQTFVANARRASFGAALPLLAEGKSLYKYTFTSEPAYHRYTSWLLQIERFKKENRDGSAEDAEDDNGLTENQEARGEGE